MRFGKESSPMNLAPIALFAYNRPWHFQKTIEALQGNELALESELFVFSDGQRDGFVDKNIKKVREYSRAIEGFKNIVIVERGKNFGLSKSIISGVSEIVDKYGKVIVLEDDLVTSPYFLTFMNETLEFYQDKERVISIHGYIYPVNKKLPETFFIKGADCWGWATWKRGWDLFEKDGTILLEQLQANGQLKEFDFNNTWPYSQMLKDQIGGKNDSWAIRWYASAFLKNKLTLYPGRSLVVNIGTDGTGIHCGIDNSYATNLAQSKVDVKEIEVSENGNVRKIIEEFFQDRKVSFFARLKRRIREVSCR